MKKILLVEDEEALRVSIARILRERGYEVDEACDGEEGLERLKAGGGYGYGLVICDVTMPVLDGVSMLRAAILELAGTPVLLMSGYSLDALPDLSGLHLHLLRKPIVQSRLTEEVGALLAA